MSDSGIDRRQTPRVPYGAWVQDVTANGPTQFYLARNLSLGGILLESPEPPEVGHRVCLKLVIENEPRVLDVLGKVIRHQDESGQTTFAVQFVELDEARRKFLQDLVAESSGQSLL